MTCEQAAEFVSALFDGETIPGEAAKHIGICGHCTRRIREYAEIGAELRRIASVDFAEESMLGAWRQEPRTSKRWWEREGQTMRIPRLAFASLVAGVVILGSSLAVVSVRARSEGTVVWLKIADPSGNSRDCPLSSVDKKHAMCGAVGVVNHGMLSYEIDLLSKSGSQAELGVRASFTPFAPGSNHHSVSFASIKALPQKQYAFEPGEPLQLDVQGLGKMTVTGDWTDHMPSLVFAANRDLDPGPSELRLISPVLMQGNSLVADLARVTLISDRLDMGVVFYEPGLGRYELALSPLKGAIEGTVKLNRISFELDHRPCVFITGTPVARGEKVWILHDADFKPPSGQAGGFTTVVHLGDELVQKPDQN